MVSEKIVREQLKRVGFKTYGWGRAEVGELPNILLPDEEIYDLVNGIYDNGFALLVATDIRLILIDKKPLNYLSVGDMRFDQINELDYSHRLFGAYITISSGSKTMRFRSYNQPRLRKVITHVQHCMADSKKKQSTFQEDQRTHLEQINQQLQAYLIAQHQQQEQLREELEKNFGARASGIDLNPVKPSPALADYLYAQQLLSQYRQQTGKISLGAANQPPAQTIPNNPTASQQLAELYNEGTSEIFGKHAEQIPSSPAEQIQPQSSAVDSGQSSFDVNPLTIIRAKLPMALRNRKFGRPSFHAHSQQPKIHTGAEA